MLAAYATIIIAITVSLSMTALQLQFWRPTHNQNPGAAIAVDVYTFGNLRG